MTTNLNILAEEITHQEGGKENLDITQIKEVIGILGRRWRSMTEEEFLEEITAIKDRAGKN